MPSDAPTRYACVRTVLLIQAACSASICLETCRAPKMSRSAEDRHECVVHCFFQADDGYLYPLEKAFFYVHKPPTLLPHDDIESIEFQRQGGGVLAASAKTFDLTIRLKSDSKQVALLLFTLAA